jgi:hypothetical protein
MLPETMEVSLETLPVLVFSGNYYLPRKLLLPETMEVSLETLPVFSVAKMICCVSY